MSKVHYTIFPDIPTLATDLGEAISRLVQDNGKHPFHIALSGGRTPKTIFDYLAKNHMGRDYLNHIHFWWGDERCVPPENPDSNYRMAREHLFGPIGIWEEHIHRIHGEADPLDEAERYSRNLSLLLPMDHDLPVFDLILLGMGEDGHTASIFPDQMDLLIDNQICRVVQHPESGQKRITLTGPVLKKAHNVFFLVTGGSKAEKVRIIVNKEHGHAQYPASHISGDHVHWFLDKPAAALL